MTHTSASGTLGTNQLLSFTHDANDEAVTIAAQQLGLTQTKIEVGDVVSATEYLREHASPETLLVEITNADDAPAQLDALADVLNPLTKVIVCGTIDSVRLYHWLMDIGIHEYLLQPFTEMQLAHAISKGAPVKPAATHADTVTTRKLIAVVGARGGVGTTTLAINLGAIFARDYHIPTAVFDLDPYFGSVALSLDLEAGHGLRDALEKPDRVDALFLERVMVKPFDNLSILSAEEPLSEPIVPQANAGDMIFAALREKFEYVVVDVPRQMNPISRYVLAHADHVVIVAEPHLPALRDALRLKDYLVDSLKRPAPQLVLNRIGLAPKHELPLKEFVKHYGAEPAMQFPHLGEALAANADGQLLVNVPKIKAAIAPLYTFAEGIVGKLGKAEKEAGGTSLLARFKGKK